MTAPADAAPPICPLCGASAQILEAQAASEDLIRLYQSFFRLEIRRFFAPASTIGLWRCPTCDLLHCDPPITGDDAFYGALARFDWYYQADKHEFASADALIPAAATVLEVGCGPGLYGQRRDKRLYVGLETSSLALERAKALGLDARPVLIQDYARQYPGMADAVVSFQVLEHVAAPAAFLQACVDALRPGGRLVLSVPNAEGFMRGNVNDILNLPPHHVTRWSPAAFQWVARRWGLRLIGCEATRLGDGPHKRWFARNLIDRALLNFVGVAIDGPLTTHPLWFKFQPLSDALAGILQHGFVDPGMEPPGHTLIAAFEKPGEGDAALS
jgi:SAM-dependent methyltransferase